MRADVLAELKALRLHGMAQAWGELQAQGNHHGLQTEGWLIEHLLRGLLVFSAISDGTKS